MHCHPPAHPMPAADAAPAAGPRPGRRREGACSCRPGRRPEPGQRSIWKPRTLQCLSPCRRKKLTPYKAHSPIQHPHSLRKMPMNISRATAATAVKQHLREFAVEREWDQVRPLSDTAAAIMNETSKSRSDKFMSPAVPFATQHCTGTSGRNWRAVRGLSENLAILMLLCPGVHMTVTPCHGIDLPVAR
jgi:hypothetical protein